jgi:hypothetical protein
MSKKMASVLIAYGIGLAGLGLVGQQIAPASGRITLVTGLASGGLSLLWALAALAGLKGRAGAILTAIPTAFVLLTRAVHVWIASASEGAGSLIVRLLVTAMFLLAVGILMYLLHGERPPEFYQTHRAGDVRKTP